MTKKLVLSKTTQLVDLNGDAVNFRCKFVAKSENGDFYGAIVDQSRLDSGESIEFRESENGLLSGNMVINNNKKQSYYLVLKSKGDQSQPISVDTNIYEMPVVAQTSSNLKWWLLGLGAVIVIVVTYYYFTKSSQLQSPPQLPPQLPPQSPPQSPQPFDSPVEVMKVEKPVIPLPVIEEMGEEMSEEFSTFTEPVLPTRLMDKLRNLPSLNK